MNTTNTLGHCVFGFERHTFLDAAGQPYDYNNSITHDAIRPGMDKPNGVCAFHAQYLLESGLGWTVTPVEAV